MLYSWKGTNNTILVIHQNKVRILQTAHFQRNTIVVNILNKQTYHKGNKKLQC